MGAKRRHFLRGTPGSRVQSRKCRGLSQEGRSALNSGITPIPLTPQRSAPAPLLLCEPLQTVATHPELLDVKLPVLLVAVQIGMTRLSRTRINGVAPPLERGPVHRLVRSTSASHPSRKMKRDDCALAVLTRHVNRSSELRRDDMVNDG